MNGTIRASFVSMCAGLVLIASITRSSAAQSKHVEAEVASEIVPSPVLYGVLLPPGYDESAEPYPLVLNLHGGGGNRDGLKRQIPMFERLWAEGELPPMVIAMASVTPRGFYMNFKDGSQMWEDFMTGDFLEHLRSTYNISRDRSKTFITGISMGGMGSLRIAFKHPDLFGGVAGMEPGIEPILEWGEMRAKHRFWRADDLFERTYGKPVDPDFWAANNPASIAAGDPARLRDSGLQIYIEAGDEDEFWLYEGTEFLHRILWDGKIKHEHHLVRGAGHIGPSLAERTEEAYQFLARTMRPWPKASPQGARGALLRRLDRLKARLDEQDHYHVED